MCFFFFLEVLSVEVSAAGAGVCAAAVEPLVELVVALPGVAVPPLLAVELCELSVELEVAVPAVPGAGADDPVGAVAAGAGARSFLKSLAALLASFAGAVVPGAKGLATAAPGAAV